jgi:transposase
MCLKVHSPWPMPGDTAGVCQALLSENNPYRLIGERLFNQFSEQAYADLYAPEGKPAVSPVILAFVTVFQFLEKLPDRAAAEGVRVRLDWKYALHLPLSYVGFDFSVLSEFRQRLLSHEAEGRVFETLVQAFRAQGLIKSRGIQRTDSVAMLTKVRDLSRLELVVETLRLAVQAVVKAAPAWSQRDLPPSWEERYAPRFILQRHTETEKQDYEARIGADGQWLLDRLAQPDPPEAVCDLPAIQLLRTVWQQHFQAVNGQIRYTPPGHYDGHTQIQTPHDPDARYSRKREFAWIGGKVQVTETDDENHPHLITDIRATCSSYTDYEALPRIQDRLQQRECLPAQHYVDSAYVSGPNLAASGQKKIDLVGPVPTVISHQAKLPEGITTEQFTIDVASQQATCPAGICIGASAGRPGKLRFLFPKALCLACALHDRCCLGHGGRTVTVSPSYPWLQAARRRQTTDAFKQAYRHHRSGVEGCLSALVRGHGLRASRYIGNRKRQLQALFTGAAANLKRAAHWLAGDRPRRYHRTWHLATPETS